jgi:hypothetical protein
MVGSVHCRPFQVLIRSAIYAPWGGAFGATAIDLGAKGCVDANVGLFRINRPDGWDVLNARLWMLRAWRFELVLGVFALLLAVAPMAHSEPDGAATIVVTAKLVEIPSKPPPDDLYDYAYVMRYEVIGGPLDKASILVAHYKPLQPRSKIRDKMREHVSGKLRSFVPGDVHKLKLSPDLKKIWKGPVIDEFEATDRKSIRYFCLQADPG